MGRAAIPNGSYRKPDQVKVIQRLLQLANSRGSKGISGDMQYRVEFLALAFRHHLVTDITRYELWDEGWEGLGEREFDACFEMGDGSEVVAALIQKARAEDWLDCIEAQLNQETYTRWLEYDSRQRSLF